MQKQKKVRAYTRKLKSGKTIVVKAHTAKYDASDKIKPIKESVGAGEELRRVRTSVSIDPEKWGFTKDEFSEWYEGTGSKEDKKVTRLLKKKLGTKEYNRLSNLAADNYKKGGSTSFFRKNLFGHSKSDEKPKSSKSPKVKKSITPKINSEKEDISVDEPKSSKKKSVLREYKVDGDSTLTSKVKHPKGKPWTIADDGTVTYNTKEYNFHFDSDINPLSEMDFSIANDGTVTYFPKKKPKRK
jgi:hypothetical protein